jgi:phage nucleotide-binding protein
VLSNGIKVLVYGESGSGKTFLTSTLENPVVLSVEAGLLSLHAHEIQFVEIKDLEQLREAYAWALESKEAQQFPTVVLDSISEIAEVVLIAEKKKTKDPRAAYGEMQSTMAELVRAFRDLPKRNVYMSAKVEKQQDDLGRLLYSASMPGVKAGQALPYHFDEVFALRVERDAEGKPQRGLQCNSDGLWMAKDRSGKLDAWESADLGVIFEKIGG